MGTQTKAGIARAGQGRGKHRVARLMKQAELQGIPSRSRWRIRKSGDRPQNVTNHLGRDYAAERPNAKWVIDITFIRTRRLAVSRRCPRFVFQACDRLSHALAVRVRAGHPSSADGRVADADLREGGLALGPWRAVHSRRVSSFLEHAWDCEQHEWGGQLL